MLTYAACHDLMQQFGKGNDVVVSQLESSVFKADAGTAPHLCNIAEEAYRLRKKIWLDKLGNKTFVETIRTISELEIQLSHLRRDLALLYRFCHIPFFPEQLKTVLRQDLLQFAEQLQSDWKKRLPVSGSGDQMRLLLSKTISPQVLQQAYHTPLSTPPDSSIRKIIF